MDIVKQTVYTRRFSPQNCAPPTVLAAPFRLLFLSSLSPWPPVVKWEIDIWLEEEG